MGTKRIYLPMCVMHEVCTRILSCSERPIMPAETELEGIVIRESRLSRERTHAQDTHNGRRERE